MGKKIIYFSYHSSLISSPLAVTDDKTEQLAVTAAEINICFNIFTKSYFFNENQGKCTVIIKWKYYSIRYYLLKDKNNDEWNWKIIVQILAIMIIQVALLQN